MEWHTKQVWLKGDALDVLAMSLFHPEVVFDIQAGSCPMQPEVDFLLPVA
jgi:hypothetical protein